MSEYVKRPVNVSPMNEFLFVISAEHACRNPLANHPMFELHWVDSMSVLQVPQTKSFNKETLLCACLQLVKCEINSKFITYVQEH